MDEKINKYEEFEALEATKDNGEYVLRLFVTGINPKSKKSYRKSERIIKRKSKRPYELEIIDIYQQPILAKEVK